MNNLPQKRFLVCCKCGHVGRPYYIALIFPVWAADKRDAAAKARNIPGVKHDHQSAILWVREATPEEFRAANEALDNDPYWQGARRNGALLVDRLEAEPEYHLRNGRGTNLKEYEKSNKKETRGFRVKKSVVIETEIRAFIADEYGVAM